LFVPAAQRLLGAGERQEAIARQCLRGCKGERKQALRFGRRQFDVGGARAGGPFCRQRAFEVSHLGRDVSAGHSLRLGLPRDLACEADDIFRSLACPRPRFCMTDGIAGQILLGHRLDRWSIQ
jgi:hypothetical protein